MKGERMRAVRITSHGGPEVLEVAEVSRPAEASHDRVRVRVRAAGLNRADILQRMGRYPAPPGVVQDIPGLEFAGEIEQVGEEVRSWRVGQRVFGITAGGAQAEYIIVPQGALAEIPPHLDWAEAAAVPEVFITAHDALFTQAQLEMGERVLVHAAGSGVGTAATQLARAAGAVAYGTSRTPEKLERAREFGLEEGVAVGDRPALFADAVREWTHGAGVNVVLDLVGGAYLAASLDALAPLGRLMLVGTTAGASAPLDFGTVMRKRLRITGTVLRSRNTEEKALATARFARHVVPLLASGRLRPVVDKIYSIDEVRAAHARLESNASFGKIVLLI
ncbi:MAG TPA: NAD(P)H-quinone oxidoreductase [Pyrinomonadaceae bacterium]|jgi:putative PIG3 family NAD(P)H quinone oxidoreductase|nr:NAD(P)H-quinone oxidoreductase [Pyrinomonadaceae bacterium]